MKLRSAICLPLVLLLGLTLACQGAATMPEPESTAPSTASTLAQQPSPTATAVPSTATQPPLPSEETLYGVSLSPRSYQQEDFLDFFGLAQQAGGVVRWAGDWAELGKAGGGAEAVAGLAGQFNYVPVFEANVFSQSPTELLRPLTDEQVEEYVRLAREFAEKERPRYLGLGIEVNILYEEMPEEFDRLVVLFGRAAQAVKEVSPETQVYVTFQLERMHGLAGGLWGGVNDPAEARWELVDRFPQADLIAFTTYPGLNYRHPDDVPPTHYTEILEHVGGRPVAFTEVGWHSGEIFEGWDSTEAEQAAFVARFLELVEPLSPSLALWAFMFDFTGESLSLPFRSMALMRDDNTPRPAFLEWQRGAGTAR